MLRHLFVPVLVGLAAGPVAMGQCTTIMSAPSDLPSPGSYTAIAVVDLNHDGHSDIVAVSGTALNGGVSRGLLSYLGNGDGSFALQFQSPTACGLASLVIADFTGDGHADAAVSSLGCGGVELYPGLGDGQFASAYLASSDAGRLSMADFNGDSHSDLAVITQGGAIRVLLGRGNGTFYAGIGCAPGQSAPACDTGSDQGQPAIDDFNDDDRPDMAVPSGSSLFVRIGSGDGYFQALTQYAAGDAANFATSRDVDGDGSLDILVANRQSGSISIFRGFGSGTFHPQYAISAGTRAYPEGIAVGDFAGDAFADMAIANGTTAHGTGGLSILTGRGDGTFVGEDRYLVGRPARRVISGDLNADGLNDLVVTFADDSPIAVMLGRVGEAIVAEHPRRATAIVGGSATFETTVNGPTPVTYQWRKDGVPLVDGANVLGALTPSLQLVDLQMVDNGAAFDCAVTNGCGAGRSNPAGLIVTENCPADYNGSGSITVQDIFDYLAAYFAGCP